MGTLDLAQVARVQSQLAEQETAPEAPLTAEELDYYWKRGNNRRPLPPNHASNTKVNIVDGEQRWIAFCASLNGSPDWKSLVKTLSWDNRGLVESFARYLMRRDGSKIKALSALRVYLRELWAVYRKYTADTVDARLETHTLRVLKLEIAPKFGLRVEPKPKNTLGPNGFLYLAHFRWVRDRTTFKIGLDRLDDAFIRILLMWTGCRRHELVYAQPRNVKKKIKRYDDESDAYTDVDNASDAYIQQRPKTCWVCGGPDERTDAEYKVLCWEDIDFLIIRDPYNNGGRDYLAMEVLLRFHKGHNKEMVPTWYPFVEEKLPLLCPLSHLLAKARAEGVIDWPGGEPSTESFFSMKLGMPSVKVPWKKEFLHKPVFRQTIESGEKPKKSDKPLTKDQLDNNSKNLGKAAGLPALLQSYDYRRGDLETIDTHYRETVRDQAARHRPKSTVYQRYYHNARMNAVVQDAFLGRGTETPYLNILNHIGLRYDENAPTDVPDEFMCAVGPDAAVRKLEEEWSALEARLQAKYGRSCRATGTDAAERDKLATKLRAARQRQRRRVAQMLRHEYFEEKNRNELDKQFRGLHGAQQPLQRVIFRLPERRRIADILGDLSEDLPEREIVRRKVDAIDAWVDYAWEIEPKEPKPSKAPAIPMEMAKQATTPPPVVEVPGPGPIIAPKPWYASMIREVAAYPAPLPPSAPTQTPPPPYTPTAHSSLLHPAILGANGMDGLPAPQPLAPRVWHECIFCGKRFTRKGTMWNCAERHLKRRKTEAVPCPVLECRSKGVVLLSEMLFKNHAKVVHGHDLRPRITTRKKGEPLSPMGVQSTPKIILTWRKPEPVRHPKVILRLGGRDV